METVSNVDEYAKEFPADVQEILHQIRMTAKKAAPKAAEKISYGMPTLHDNGNIIPFAAFEKS